MIIFGGKQCINYGNLVLKKGEDVVESLDLTGFEYTTDGNGVATTSKYIGTETNVVVPKSRTLGE